MKFVYFDRISRPWLRRGLIVAAIVVAIWLLSSFAVAYRMTRRPRPPLAEPVPAIAWGTIEQHRLKTPDGEEIGAWFVRGQDQAPAVLLLHGNRGRRRDCLERAAVVAAHGCTVLMISLRAHGDSTGQFNDMGYSARHDVGAAVEFLERHCPAQPVIVYGFSMGAATAVFAAGELAHRVNGYILESPYQDLKVAVRNRTRTHLPPVLDWVAYEGLLTVSPLVLPHVDKISPLSAIGTIPTDVPVLIMAGGRDRLARPGEAQAIHKRVQSHSKLVVFAKAGHHDLIRTDPARFRDAVFGLVRDVELRKSSASSNRIGR